MTVDVFHVQMMYAGNLCDSTTAFDLMVTYDTQLHQFQGMGLGSCQIWSNLMLPLCLVDV